MNPAPVVGDLRGASAPKAGHKGLNSMPITATYSPVQFKLTILGMIDPDGIVVSRNAAGGLLVNAGAVSVTGGTPTVANTSLIEILGDAGADTISLDEALGALPAAEIYAGAGNDTVTGGSNGDTLLGEADDDTLFGKGGADLLYGGLGNDSLTGGDGDDQIFGEDGNDRMIWNPGDDTDLMEGGIGTDTVEVNGGGGAEVFTVTANGLRVRFDRVDPAPFMLDIGTSEALILNAGGGDDSISTTGNLAALISLTLDGGAGNDTILGSNGLDILIGGDGTDFIDGQQGNDAAFLGAGNDTFQWDPGDGSDTVEGQGDIDQLLFNGSAANEIFDLSPNGGRVTLFRNLGSIVMDHNDVETFTINALAGTDNVNINNLAGTDATQVAINLSGTIGGTSGDAVADVVTVAGTGGNDVVAVTGAGTSFNVAGLAAAVTVTNSEGANDTLVVNGFGGDDAITATALPAGVVKLTLDGGTGADSLLGSQGADVFLGGDGNDTVEGQANFDELRFIGSNASENVDILANGGRVLFFRNVANVTMDLDDVEKVRFDALGAADNIVVGDLTGTDATNIELRLAGVGGGDGAIDTVTVSGSNGIDQILASSTGGTVSVTGMPWTVSILDAEGANDKLTLNGLGSDDIINASTLAAGLVTLTINGGLGNDLIIGSEGADLVNGGDGNDVAFLDEGNDVFVWNPGDDNDTIEGQAGSDTLRFNGSAVAETITISPNGGRAIFFRDIANVTMDLNDTEVIEFAALGGVDTIVVSDLSATDVTQLAIDLASTLGGAAGDAQVDMLTLNASGGDNAIVLSGATGALLTVTGLPASVTISQFETSGTVDKLTIQALGGNDTISATGLLVPLATLTIDGGGGNDTIRSNGEGIYLGNIGDDTIFAGLTSSLESLDGGTGIDTLDTTTWGGDYTVNLVTGATNYSGEAFTNFENLITGAGGDTITGTAGANTIRTNGGVDNVIAGDGNDLVEGGASGDTLAGGVGIDTLAYDSSDAGVTVSLTGNTANGGHATGDVISGFENLAGSAHADTLTGDGIANSLIGGGGADNLNGQGGADYLDGGTGNDTTTGGTGDDVHVVDQAGDVIVELAGGGFDRAYALASYTLGAGVQVEVLATGGPNPTAAIGLSGNELTNNLWANEGANALLGYGGVDSLFGYGGDDYLDGGTGADLLVGGLGNDVYVVDDLVDFIVEYAGEGEDKAYAMTGYTLAAGASIEILIAGGPLIAGGRNLTGNELANNIWDDAGDNDLYGAAGNDALFGFAGHDYLDGGTGTDFLVGGTGDDILVVDQAGDVVVELAGEGSDTVYASADYTVAAGQSIEILAAGGANPNAALVLAGNELANNLWGNAGHNLLNGAGGNDAQFGFAGNDNLFGGDGNDFLVGGAGNDNLWGGNGADTLLGEAGADSFLFNTLPGPGNVDVIADFSLVDDLIALSSGVFAGLAPGALPAGVFVVGSAAGDANDRIVYNQATGALSYDADGNGAGAAVQFATVNGLPALTASDFLVQ